MPASYLEALAKGGERPAWWREGGGRGVIHGTEPLDSLLVVLPTTCHFSAMLGYQNEGSSSLLVLFSPPCSSRLPDGLTRRGDINLLMLGDPGTAKSQLLKFVEKCSPIGVGGLGAQLQCGSFLPFVPCVAPKTRLWSLQIQTCLCICGWTGWQSCKPPFLVLTWKRCGAGQGRTEGRGSG